ncbi:two-partner secretion domain-containing protein [Psychrobacter alimentarius]|uniref:two-partner secretion domain-containing protein n=1 Tax=Psychrobacter alimentarius TaxID=261164 RepID=UPI0019190FA0|nr:polymorphic toxin-type HINT domain-containing protein [Psychrobacter alimentarius]
MNKQCYRVVFNKARGMMMVVSEVTKSQNKKAGNSGSKTSASTKSVSQSGTNVSYHRLALAILCCQSMVYTQVQAANSQIQNTASNVPAAQRAALLKATNGTPIVNIRTPNSNGLSHNTYNQFDIGSNGAILNNSIGGATTQLAGAIAGNQYLAKNAANTILNEVRSNAPAKFQGNLEIAGQRADVIIASPSGLQIQGGGFINANQATLTTGTPKIDSAGNLTGFDVKQGQIQFDNAATGNALGGDLYDGKNKNQANYVDVLARAVTINGQIHANQDVNMVIGSNTIDYDTGEATKITGTGTAPTLAVDVSTLGGIYANSINLVGTESGLGVRNAGNIQATQQIVLTNSGKIENTGTIKTTKAQTSLLSINATGTTGSIEHSGTISSYGMIDMQANKNILLNGGIIKKQNPGTATQLMPDILQMDAAGDLKMSNSSDVRNFTIVDDEANIYLHSGRDTFVDSQSIVGSNGGISIEADRFVRLLDGSNTFARYAPLTVHSKNGTWIDSSRVSGRGDVHISASKTDDTKTANTIISNNSELSARKALTISGELDASIKSGSYITESNELALQAGRNALIDNSGSIKATNDAVVQAGELAYLRNNSQPIDIGKQLIVQGKQAMVVNTTVDANDGIYINSQGKDTTITNSNLNSSKGAVTAIANEAALNVNKLNTNANSTILAATGDVSVVGSKFTTDNIAIESGQNLTATQLTTVNKDSKQTGSINTKSKGTTDITSSQLKNTGNISINSDKYLTIIDTDIDSGKNLNLETKQNIYSNIRLDRNSEGVLYNNYDVSTKQNAFTAAEVLSLDSAGRQVYKDTDFKGSAILSNAGSNYILSTNLNLTSTGVSKNVDKNINGNIQLVNKGTIALNKNHTISAKNDLTIQADKGITITKVPKIVAQNIALKTTVASTVKNDEGVDNTFGEGDISIVGTELSATGTTGSELIIDAANHLNVIDSKTTSVSSTTMKSGNLMRLNNSDISSGQHLTIDSKNQLITNGERYAKNSGTEEAPKWSNSLRHIAGDTILHADEIVSINTGWAQPYQNTDITGGAVIINSGSTLGFNSNTNINATGNAKLAKNTTKLSNGTIASTLNGDLIISNTVGNLTIAPNNVTLAATGDATLAARGGQLYLKGYKGTQGFGSEKVVKLTAGGDINLSGKEVVIEGSDLISKKGFSGSNVVLVDGKSVPTAGISITATDGSVELKAIKNSFSNYVSPYNSEPINQQVIEAQNELKTYNAGIALIERKSYLDWKIRYEFGRDDGYPEPHIEMRDQLIHSSAYKKALLDRNKVDLLRNQLNDLNFILENSKKAATGFEHKAASFTSSKDIDITAKQGVLIEGADITSSNGGISILAEGNLVSTKSIDIDQTTNIDKTNVNNDSILITGLADIYQRGDMTKGVITGNNYSYHQLIKQPTLVAKGDIKILGNGNLVKSSDKYDAKTKSYITNNSVILNSADIQSTDGDVRIDAAHGDINLEASQVAFMDGSQNTSKSSSWYGKKKTKTTTRTSENSNAVTTDIQANNISLIADGNISIYGSDLTAAPTGIIRLTAGNGLYLYAIDDIVKSTTDVKKKSSFLGVRYNKDHTNDTRQELTQLPAKLIGDKAYTKSGGDTLLQGSVFKTLKASDIQVGVGKYADDAAKVILEPITNQITTTHKQEKESTVWMKTVDQGSVVTTASLPKFNQVPTITSPNGVTVVVPVEVTVDANNKAKTNIQKSPEELGKIALNLSKQPGYEYLAALDKTNHINWEQVDLIQKNWNYTQEGLTPGAAALIAIAVTIATSGAGGAAGMGATLTGTTGATGAAATAAFSSLAAQASVTLINNKGDINKTLNQLASSATVRSMATAALTAGVGAKLGLAGNATDTFGQKLANGVGTGVTNAVADAALNGASFEEALKNGLRGALVDVFAAETFGKFVKDFEGDDFASDLAHKLVAAGVGCVTASAKKQDCNAGAIGAAVGEIMAEAITDEETKLLHKYGLLSPKEELRIENIATLTAGTIALLLNVNVDTAASSATLAVKNNYNGKPLQDLELDEGFLKAYAALTGLVLRPVIGAEFYSKYNSATTNAQREKILVEAGLSMVVSKTLASKFTKVRACFVAGTLVETIDGLRAIETIEQGDLVWSRHEETLEYGYRPVVATVSFDNKNIYEVVVRDNHGKLETYQTTEEHPFWVVDTGWLPASLLQTGMTLVNRDEQAVLKVISQTKINKTDTVYNFEVEEFHTYYIGEFGTWVHNANCAVDNMSSFFSNFDFGKRIQSKSFGTKLKYDGQKIYKVTTKDADSALKKGDYYYLDGMHKDHIEVYDSNGLSKFVLNLDGTKNIQKTIEAEGRRINVK